MLTKTSHAPNDCAGPLFFDRPLLFVRVSGPTETYKGVDTDHLLFSCSYVQLSLTLEESVCNRNGRESLPAASQSEKTRIDGRDEMPSRLYMVCADSDVNTNYTPFLRRVVTILSDYARLGKY